LLGLLQDLARLFARFLPHLLRGRLRRLDDCVHLAADVGLVPRLAWLFSDCGGVYVWTILHRSAPSFEPQGSTVPQGSPVISPRRPVCN
jgi:hypothetical protein